MEVMIDKFLALPGGFCEERLGYVLYFHAGFVMHRAGTNAFFSCAELVVPSDKGKNKSL